VSEEGLKQGLAGSGARDDVLEGERPGDPYSLGAGAAPAPGVVGEAARARQADDQPSALDEADGPPARPRAGPLPFVAMREIEAPTPSVEDEARWTQRIESLVREAKAQAGAPAAAPLWFEAGRIFEIELGRLREAATHYGEANKADPTFLPVIHSARRLFAQLGKWGMVVFLIDQELNHEGAPRASLLVEKGRIHETKLALPGDAAELFRQALTEDPAYAPAVDSLLRLLRRSEDLSGVAAVLEAAVAASSNVAQKVAWLVDLGRHAESRLKDEGRALGYYEQARALAPTRRLILSALRRLYSRTGEEAKLAAALAELARLTTSPAEAVQYLQRRAQLLIARGDEPGAVRALEEAMARVPTDTLVLTELARLYEKHEAGGSLVDVLEAQAKCTHDTSEKVALFHEAGRMAEERLGDTDRAVRYYYACVEQDPTYQPALSALGKLYARGRRYKELADIFDAQIRGTTDDTARVPLLYKLAELLHERLQSDDGAIERLKAVLEISPGYVPALKLISTLFARQGRWAELIEMYEAELRDQDDKDQAIFVLERIASLYEGKLENLEQAVLAYRRMLEHQPSYLPALRSLGRLYARMEQWDELITINTEESQIIGDQNHVVALLFRNGEIFEEKLGQAADAIEAYRHALTLMPNYLPALRALGRIYAKEERWIELIDMHREEAEVARTPQMRAQLLCSMGELFDTKLDDKDSAAACYREVLEGLPTYHPAIRALSRIAQQTGDFQGLVDTLKSELGVVRDPRDRALMRCRIAELTERCLGQQEAAGRELENAIDESPGLFTAHEQLVSLRARQGSDAAEATARERMQDVIADIDGRVANLRALGELYLYRLDDTQRALTAYERLLSERADDKAALRSLTDCALRLRDYRAAIRYAEALAEVESSADEVANLHLQVAAWREAHLDPPEDSLRNHLKALEYDPLNPVAVRAVENAYLERGELEGLFYLYERERAGTEVPSRVADLSMKMGDIAERRFGDDALTAKQFEVALQAQPDLLPAIGRLKECYKRLNRPEDQLRMLAFEANASKDDGHAITTLLEVATLQQDKFQNTASAVESYRQVLRRQPSHGEAFTALEKLLREGQRYRELAELYAARADAFAEPTHKVGLWLRAAQLLLERLGADGVTRALGLYEQVLAQNPDHPTALAQIGNIAFAMQHWERAREAYLRLIDATGELPVKAAAAFSLGVIYQEHLPDPDQAAEMLEASLKVQPHNTEALSRLARANMERGLMPAALNVRQTLLQLAGTPDEQLKQHVAIAELFEHGFKEAAQAAAAYERALAVATDPQMQSHLLSKAAALYQRIGDLDGYLSAARKHAMNLAVHDATGAAAILFHNAHLVLEHKQDPRAAIELAEEGVRLTPHHTELLGFLADLLSTGEPSGRAIELHRKIFSLGIVRVSSLHGLHKMWSDAGASDRAFVAAEILSFLGAADAEEDITFGQGKGRVRVETDEALTLEQLSSWVVHPAQRNVVHEILSVVATELTKLFPEDVSHYKVDKKDVFKSKSGEPLRMLADLVATNLGGLPFELHRTVAKPYTVAAHHAATPILMVGAEVTRAYQTREQRFLLGRALVGMRCGHHLIRDMSASDLAYLLSAIGRSVDKSFPALREDAELPELTKRVTGSLSRQARRRLAEPVAQLAELGSSLDLAAFLAAVPLTEARGGLMLSGSFSVAARLYARHRGTLLAEDTEMLIASLEADAVLNDLFTYALSDEYFHTRQTLRFALDA
jgi:cellulose synthase operon protein C